MRTERDMLGELELADNCPWGIHTERARRAMSVSSRTVHPGLIAAYADVKRACAMANAELGYLEPDPAAAIIAAATEIATGAHAHAFPLDALQGGAGTSTNMNLNEVIAHIATGTLRSDPSDTSTVDPINHVNLHQSTNDTYPTALKIAAIRGVRALSERAAELQGALQKREQDFAAIITIGRTEMVDAVPMTLGAIFGGFAEAVSRDRWRTFKSEERLRTINLGGTAVGTGLTAPRRYIFLVIEKLRELTGIGLSRAENLPAETAHADALVEASGILAACAATLSKIADDLRRMQQCGEIRLRPVQAGSSIMPGKVNPVLPECVIQSCIVARANHALVTECASRGSLQINEFLPLLAAALLEAIDLLTKATGLLATCVAELDADADRCRAHADQSPALITAFVPELGYARCTEIAMAFAESPDSDFRAFLVARVGEALVTRILSPTNLLALGHR